MSFSRRWYSDRTFYVRSENGGLQQPTVQHSGDQNLKIHTFILVLIKIQQNSTDYYESGSKWRNNNKTENSITSGSTSFCAHSILDSHWVPTSAGSISLFLWFHITIKIRNENRPNVYYFFLFFFPLHEEINLFQNLVKPWQSTSLVRL